MTEIQIPLHLDEKLLLINKYENLAKNYTSLKNVNTTAPCKETRLKCEIITNLELTNAFNSYLSKIQSSAEANYSIFVHEKLSNVSQEVQKWNEVSRNGSFVDEKITNDDIANNAPSILMTRKIPVAKVSPDLPKNEKKIKSSGYSASSSASLIDPHKTKTTADDFLIKQLIIKDSKPNTIMHQNADVIIHRNKDSQIYTSQAHTEEYQRNKNPLNKTSSMHFSEAMLKEKTPSVRVDKKFEKLKPSPERPYVCSICKMAFKRNLHLKRHFTVTHTVGKNFKCGICGRRFSREDYLDKHVSGHQKKKFKLKLLQQGIVVRTKMTFK